jgi:hypothetical protein
VSGLWIRGSIGDNDEIHGFPHGEERQMEMLRHGSFDYIFKGAGSGVNVIDRFSSDESTIFQRIAESEFSQSNDSSALSPTTPNLDDQTLVIFTMNQFPADSRLPHFQPHF